jgi:hypothetical protein
VNAVFYFVFIGHEYLVVSRIGISLLSSWQPDTHEVCDSVYGIQCELIYNACLTETCEILSLSINISLVLVVLLKVPSHIEGVNRALTKYNIF